MSARPNVVLLFADDIPRNMLGAYGAQGGLSPHIDGLAKDGITFERAYTTAPLCTPSRFSLLTGRYASNASSIVSHRPWNLVGFNTFLTSEEPTIAHRLRRSGYATCFVGKVRRASSARGCIPSLANAVRYDASPPSVTAHTVSWCACSHRRVCSTILASPFPVLCARAAKHSVGVAEG
jgi:hypothetical protein